jgi:hypothetical protein
MHTDESSPYVGEVRPAGSRSAQATTPRHRWTLERPVDFDRPNGSTMRFSVGAVNVKTGEFCLLRRHGPSDRLAAYHGQWLADARGGADEKLCNIVQRIYNAKNYEGIELSADRNQPVRAATGLLASIARRS